MFEFDILISLKGEEKHKLKAIRKVDNEDLGRNSETET